MNLYITNFGWRGKMAVVGVSLALLAGVAVGAFLAYTSFSQPWSLRKIVFGIGGSALAGLATGALVGVNTYDPAEQQHSEHSTEDPA